MELDYDRLGGRTKALCKYSSYLQATAGNEAALLCARVSRQDNFVASHILPPHPYYVSMNRSRTRGGEWGDGVECVHLNTLTKPTCVTGAFCLLVTFRDINTG